MVNFFPKRLYAWLVHIFTASGSILSVLAIIATAHAYAAKINKHNIDYFAYMKISFIYIFVAIAIDSVDGTLARRVDIKKLAHLDGGLMDNIIDFTNYAVISSIWLYVSDIVPKNLKIVSVIIIMLSACYQFCQFNAKTKDNFFKGFPSYWNIAIYYLIYFKLSQITNFTIIIALSVLTFVPIKYIYPSRMNYVSQKKSIIITIFILTLTWAVATVISAIILPKYNPILTFIIISYIILYFLISVYRTLNPILKPYN